MHIYLEFYISAMIVHFLVGVTVYFKWEHFFHSICKTMVHFLINGILDSVIYSVGGVHVIQSGKFDNTSYVILDKLKLSVL